MSSGTPFLADTDWILDALAGRRRADLSLTQLAPRGISVSIITIGEIYEGAFHSAAPEAHLVSSREMLRPFPVLRLDDDTMEHFARTRSLLRREGRMIADLDLLIASTALRHELTLLTFNVRHYGRIPGLNLQGTT